MSPSDFVPTLVMLTPESASRQVAQWVDVLHTFPEAGPAIAEQVYAWFDTLDSLRDSPE